MGKTSAGILLFRKVEGRIEVLLIHPGGPFWTARDDGSWSIPKGLVEPDEDPQDAARREFQEETGFAATGNLIPLTPLKQRSGKLIRAYALPGDANAAELKSITFSMEWPPRSGKMQEFPEADRAGWFTLKQGREKIIAGQRGFLDELGKIFTDAGA